MPQVLRCGGGKKSFIPPIIILGCIISQNSEKINRNVCFRGYDLTLVYKLCRGVRSEDRQNKTATRVSAKLAVKLLQPNKQPERQNTTEEKSVVFDLQDTICQGSILDSLKSKITPDKNSIFIFEKGLDFLHLLWYCCVLTGGTANEKYNKRAMARKYQSARG